MRGAGTRSLFGIDFTGSARPAAHVALLALPLVPLLVVAWYDGSVVQEDRLREARTEAVEAALPEARW